MILVLKKRKILTCLCIAAFCIGSLSVLCQFVFTESAFLPSAGKTIIIDAGHAAHR